MDIRQLLEKGDKRTVGNVSTVTDYINRHPDDFPKLFSLQYDEDPAVRMRAADATVKVATANPELLTPFKKNILEELLLHDQKEVIWHACQLTELLTFTKIEALQLFSLLQPITESKSSIAATMALQALFSLAVQHPQLRKKTSVILSEKMNTGTPAMKARLRNLDFEAW